MYGLIWKDFLVLRKTLRLYVLFLLGYLGMALLGIFDLTFVTTFCVVILMILPISAFSPSPAPPTCGRAWGPSWPPWAPPCSSWM